nr:reverse transcriptase domain-containing protein [Tanacetum cinerariifolium]
MEVFMDDFSVFRNSFSTCLSHLEKMLKRCEDTNLCLNWEKSHFMVKEGIVLGHKISKNGIEVDKAKVDVIAKLPHPTTIKGLEPPLSVPSLVIVERTSAMTSSQRSCLSTVSLTILLPLIILRLVAIKTPIGCTPYKLVYEKACHLSIELVHKAYWTLKHANFDLQTAGDHRKVQLNELNELRNQAYEHSLIYNEKTKRLHDLKINDRVFNIGDRVLLINSR